MTTPAFFRAAAVNQADVAEHARQTSAAAAHAVELIDEAIAFSPWSAHLIEWVRSR